LQESHFNFLVAGKCHWGERISAIELAVRAGIVRHLALALHVERSRTGRNVISCHTVAVFHAVVSSGHGLHLGPFHLANARLPSRSQPLSFYCLILPFAALIYLVMGRHNFLQIGAAKKSALCGFCGLFLALLYLSLGPPASALGLEPLLPAGKPSASILLFVLVIFHRTVATGVGEGRLAQRRRHRGRWTRVQRLTAEIQPGSEARGCGWAWCDSSSAGSEEHSSLRRYVSHHTPGMVERSHLPGARLGRPQSGAIAVDPEGIPSNEIGRVSESISKLGTSQTDGLAASRRASRAFLSGETAGGAEFLCEQFAGSAGTCAG